MEVSIGWPLATAEADAPLPRWSTIWRVCIELGLPALTLPFLLATPVLFLTGAAMAYYIAIPMALHFLLGYSGMVGGVQQQWLGPRAR